MGWGWGGDGLAVYVSVWCGGAMCHLWMRSSPLARVHRHRDRSGGERCAIFKIFIMMTTSLAMKLRLKKSKINDVLRHRIGWLRYVLVSRSKTSRSPGLLSRYRPFLGNDRKAIMRSNKQGR